VTDPEAVQRFQDLYALHHRRVHAYAVSRAGRDLADEVTSEVFLIVWRRLAAVPGQPLPWLLTVARNVISDQFRATARQQSVKAEMRAWVKEEPASPDIADEVSERIRVLTALASMPEADRELLTLAAWHGLSAREAAQVLGCSTATYFVRLHRARRRLEQALADPPPGAAPGLPESKNAHDHDDRTGTGPNGRAAAARDAVGHPLAPRFPVPALGELPAQPASQVLGHGKEQPR
jgi:RNA polymerase sigma-70 factor, ECF subfamily